MAQSCTPFPAVGRCECRLAPAQTDTLKDLLSLGASAFSSWIDIIPYSSGSPMTLTLSEWTSSSCGALPCWYHPSCTRSVFSCWLYYLSFTRSALLLLFFFFFLVFIYSPSCTESVMQCWYHPACIRSLLTCWYHRPTRKRAHTLLVREHSATVASVRWATVDCSRYKEWN